MSADPLNMGDPSHPLHAMAVQMQQRQAMDAKRQAMAQALMPEQAQGPALVGNMGGPVQLPAPVVEKSPWSLGEAGFGALATAMKNGQASEKFGRGPAGQGGTWEFGKAMDTGAGLFPAQGGMKAPV